MAEFAGSRRTAWIATISSDRCLYDSFFNMMEQISNFELESENGSDLCMAASLTTLLPAQSAGFTKNNIVKSYDNNQKVFYCTGMWLQPQDEGSFSH